MEKKRQHVVPRCYLRAWCDPNTPPGQEPYVWAFSRDGSVKKKKAPVKLFTATDVYTIRMPGGGRDLLIEDTLQRIEDKFAKLVEYRLNRGHDLELTDHATLIIFAAAMFARVDAQAETQANFLQELQNKTRSMEAAHHTEPSTSKEIGAMLENARPLLVRSSLQDLALLYSGMALMLVVAPDGAQFITSDNPTVWYNPEAYTWPPFLRSPGLAEEKIEVTMPLTSRHLMFLSHNPRLVGTRVVRREVVRELNRRTRAHCRDWFVSSRDEVDSYWFEPGIAPEDRWENTSEGKLAAERKKRYEELRARSHQRVSPQPPGRDPDPGISS